MSRRRGGVGVGVVGHCEKGGVVGVVGDLARGEGEGEGGVRCQTALC